MTDLAAQLILQEEGPAASHVYQVDGLWHIARGVLVDPKVPCDGLCAAAIAAQDDYELDAAKQRAAALAGYSACNAVRQAVLTALCYQLGDMHGWPAFRAALAAGEYELAADNLLYADVSARTPSGFFRQTPRRCQREASMLRTGLWQSQESGDE